MRIEDTDDGDRLALTLAREQAGDLYHFMEPEDAPAMKVREDGRVDVRVAPSCFGEAFRGLAAVIRLEVGHRAREHLVEARRLLRVAADLEERGKSYEEIEQQREDARERGVAPEDFHFTRAERELEELLDWFEDRGDWSIWYVADGELRDGSLGGVLDEEDGVTVDGPVGSADADPGSP